MNPSKKNRILIIEDEVAMRTVLTNCLNRNGYRAFDAENGEAGFDKALKEKPDLILLDVMMPKLDGFSLCRELRRRHIRTPILILTAKGAVEDRVRGLDIGADDYLVKPFSRDELLARVRALLRRSQEDLATCDVLRFGNVVIDFVRQTAQRDGRPLELTLKEFGMLKLLAQRRGLPVSREDFLDIVWGYGAFPTTRTVDKHMLGLRRKFESDPENPVWLKTVHGIGYRLSDE